MKRDFTYKGMKFYLNANGTAGSPRREFEGRYILLIWNESAERWQPITTVDTKTEAKQMVRLLYK